MSRRSPQSLPLPLLIRKPGGSDYHLPGKAVYALIKNECEANCNEIRRDDLF